MYGPDALLLASKKPRMRELVDRAAHMSVEQIRNLPEKPDVIRGLLLIREFGTNGGKLTVADKVANAMQTKHTDVQSGNSMVCRIFRVNNANDTWVGRSSKVEVMNGWHWASVGNGKIYLSTSIIDVDDGSLGDLERVSSFVTDGLISDLIDLERKRLSSVI